MACAADDNKIHMFVEIQATETETKPDHSFQKVHVLVGHEDWVRSLDFMLVGKFYKNQKFTELMFIL